MCPTLNERECGLGMGNNMQGIETTNAEEMLKKLHIERGIEFVAT
jgi:hypothetical protein